MTLGCCNFDMIFCGVQKFAASRNWLFLMGVIAQVRFWWECAGQYYFERSSDFRRQFPFVRCLLAREERGK